MRERSAAVVVCLLSLVSWAPAETAKRALSLEEAVRIGLERSPVVHASEVRLAASEARTREVMASRLPAVRAGAGYTRLSEVPPFEVALPILPAPVVVSPVYFNTWSLRASVQQPIFTGLRLEASTEAARWQERSAGAGLEHDRGELVFAVKSAYWGLARALEVELVAEENVRRVQEHLKDVRAFFEQGLLTKDEVLRAELQLAKADLLTIDARNAVETARTALNSLLGLPLDEEVELTSPTEEKSQGLEEGPLDGPDLAAEALASRADLKAAEFMVKASESGLKAAKSGWYPQVYLTGNVYYLRPNPRFMPARDRFDATWDLGLSVAFDVWNWGQTKSQTERARAELALARDARKALEDRIVLEVTQARLALRQMQGKAEVAAKSVVQAEESLRIVRERFRQGVALNADVLAAEVALLEAKLARTQAALDISLARARLDRALGR